MVTKSRKKNTPAPPLRIEGELTIFRAAEWLHALRARPAATVIDLSGVTEIDTAGVQLLLLARREAEAEQRALRLLAPSSAVDEVFALLNLAAILGEPLAVPGAASGSGG